MPGSHLSVLLAFSCLAPLSPAQSVIHTWPTGGVPVGDVDGDGVRDRVEYQWPSYSVFRFHSGRTGQLIAQHVPAAPNIGAVVLGDAGDVDGDGRDDFAFHVRETWSSFAVRVVSPWTSSGGAPKSPATVSARAGSIARWWCEPVQRPCTFAWHSAHAAEPTCPVVGEDADGRSPPPPGPREGATRYATESTTPPSSRGTARPATDAPRSTNDVNAAGPPMLTRRTRTARRVSAADAVGRAAVGRAAVGRAAAGRTALTRPPRGSRRGRPAGAAGSDRPDAGPVRRGSRRRPRPGARGCGRTARASRPW